MKILDDELLVIFSIGMVVLIHFLSKFFKIDILSHLVISNGSSSYSSIALTLHILLVNCILPLLIFDFSIFLKLLCEVLYSLISTIKAGYDSMIVET